MTRILVLGIGSPFGADTVGWRIIDHLEILLTKNDALRHDLDLRREDRPGLRLIELISPYRRVILVDAVASGAAPGTVHHLQRDELLHYRAAPSTHLAGVTEALSLGAAIDALPEELELFGVEIGAKQPPDVAPVTAAIVERLRELGKNAPLSGA